MEYESIGKLIQTLRKDKGLTQKQLADILNVTDKAVSKWERNVACPNITTLPQLADILGVTVEVLLNAKAAIRSGTKEIVLDDLNSMWEKYKERSRQLIRQGMPGFIIGSLGMLGVFIIYFIGVSSSITHQDILGMTIGVSILMITAGLLFAGLPYGWSLINHFLGQWSIFGSIPVLIFLLGLKFAFSLWIGIIAYPIVLIYNLIRSQKTKRRVKIWTIVVISAVVLWYGFVGIYAIIDAKSNAGANRNTDSTGTSVVQTVGADSFSDQDTLVNEVCQNALDITKKEENDNVANYGWTVTETTKLHHYFKTKCHEATPS